MAEHLKGPSSASLLKNSLLYQHYQAQRDAVMKHKETESGKVGHDIGFERALTDWTLRHRSEWLKRWQTDTRSNANAGAVNFTGSIRTAL